MSLRHRLIRFLSFGDLVFINAEIANDGTLRPRNAGAALFSRLSIRQWEKPVAIRMGVGGFGDAAMKVELVGVQHAHFNDVYVDGRHPLDRERS